jgi:3-oxoacyl-[acyl-carrier protein] reductase
VTDRDAVAEAVTRARETLGAVDILVNNAAVLDHVAELERQDPARWERDVRVNLTGAFNCAQAVWPGMRERGWGRIVNMSSITAELGSYAQASYATTKAALLGLTRTLALEGARHGITVNALLPGVTSTEAVAEASAAMRERWRRRTALRRLAEPQEVANVLAFLCSDLASYVTGAAVPVSGGMELLTLPD